MSFFGTKIITSKPLPFKLELSNKLTEFGIKFGKVLDYVKINIYDSQEELFSHYGSKINDDRLCGFVDRDDYKLVHAISEELFLKIFTEKYHLKNLELMYKMVIFHECIHSLTININPNLKYSKNINLVEGIAVFGSGQLDYIREYNANKGDYYNYGLWIEKYLLVNGYKSLGDLIRSAK